MLRWGLVLAAVATLLGSVSTAQAGNPRSNLRTVELKGAIAVEGTPSAQKPVRFTARLIADTAGVPLQHGGRALITGGRVYVDTIGTVVSACLSESSLGLSATYSAGTRASAEARGDVLRMLAGRRLALDLDVSVDASLRGFSGPDCSKANGFDFEATTLRLRGALASRALAPVHMSSSARVTLKDGRRAVMTVTATATVRRYLPPS